MIDSTSDFRFVDVSSYQAFLTEFESYPARASAAGEMPYDSLSDLEGKLDPPLKCLDPAWLTELVREIDSFRRSSFYTGNAPLVSKTAVHGAKQPPVVLKAFLEEAHAAIRNWAEAWEGGGCPQDVPVDESKLPKSWQSLGSISLKWDTDSCAQEIPPGAGDYEPPETLDPVAEYRRIMAKAAVRDFLSIRLFDRQEPDDDLSTPEFAWTDTDEQFEEGDDKPGVSSRYLSRQLLAAHSDCEKASTWFLRFTPTASQLAQHDVRNVTSGQTEYNGRYKSHDDCSDGCGTIHSEQGSVIPIESDDSGKSSMSAPSGAMCPPSKVPASTGTPSGFPVRYAKTVNYDWIDYPVDSCHDGKCQLRSYSVRGFWSARTSSEQEVEWDGIPGALEYPCSLPSWVTADEVWAVMVAESRRLESEYTTTRVMTGTEGDAESGWYYTTAEDLKSKGTLKSELFVALVPATYDGSALRISSVPDVPAPKGKTSVEIPDLPPNSGGSSGSMTTRTRYKVHEDAAGIVSLLGVVVKAKFAASVKE